MKETIRLTNKTAINLRKSAQQLRTERFAAAVILSVLLGALGVFLGLLWLPAVPLMIVLIALIDGAIWLGARRSYLFMISQAICTEAAAREIRAESSETLRREQALSDLMRVKADIGEKAAVTKPFPKTQEEAEDTQAQQQEAPAQPVQQAQTPHETQDGDDAMDASPRRRRQKGLTLIKGEQAK